MTGNCLEEAPVRQERLPTGCSGQLHGRLWVGDQDPLAVIIVVHGLGDHGGRYQTLARHLADQRWPVFVFDLPGHGNSPGKRGRIKSFDDLLAEITSARRTVSKRFPQVPQLLLGHSMGGTLVINHVLRRKSVSDGLQQPLGIILCAPMLLPPNPPPRPHIFAAWLTGRLLPWICINRPVDLQSLTGNPEQAALIRADPLRHSRITVYLATQLLSQGRWALDHARQIDLPTLIMYGEDDDLIDTSACQNLAIRIGSSATLMCWPEMRHEVFHDAHSEQAMESLAEWLRQQDRMDQR